MSDCDELRATIDTLKKERDEAVAAFHDPTRLRSQIQEARIKAENERDEARAAIPELDAYHIQRFAQETARCGSAIEAANAAQREANDVLRVVNGSREFPMAGLAVHVLEAIEKLERERDAARAEAVRLFSARHTAACERQSAYNVRCVCGASEILRDLLRDVAEKQREACASAVRLWELDPSIGARSWHAHDAVRAAALVTDE